MNNHPYGIYGRFDDPTRDELKSVKHLLRPNWQEIICEIAFNDICNMRLNFEEKEDANMDTIKIQTANIQELGLNRRTVTDLNKIGIYTIEDLINTHRSKLRSVKFLGAKMINEIADALMKRDLHLVSDEIYLCSKCSKRFADEKFNTSTHYCPICKAKLDRLEEISDVSVSLSPPEYSSYTATGEGFALYANITNNTYDLQKVRVCDFYIVSDGQQRSPEYFLTGYTFTEETIIPMTSRSCAKIWSNRVMKKNRLTAADYAIITLELSSCRHMFKFVFNGETWDLDDYFKS